MQTRAQWWGTQGQPGPILHGLQKTVPRGRRKPRGKGLESVVWKTEDKMTSAIPPLASAKKGEKRGPGAELRSWHGENMQPGLGQGRRAGAGDRGSQEAVAGRLPARGKPKGIVDEGRAALS